MQAHTCTRYLSLLSLEREKKRFVSGERLARSRARSRSRSRSLVRSLLTLKRARRVVARLNKGTQEAQGRYVQFAADETRILSDLQTVDNENVGAPVAAADTAAPAEDADTPEAEAGDTQVASPAAEADTGLGDNSTAT